MTAIDDKLALQVERHVTMLRGMTARVRAAYLDGRWAAATDEQRAQTRMNFRIIQAQLRRALTEIERRAERRAKETS